MEWRHSWKLIKNAALAWQADNVSRLSASLSYYAIFSMAPLLIIIAAILSSVFGKDVAEGEITKRLTDFVGSQVAETLGVAMSAREQTHGNSIWAGAITVALIVIGATSVVRELKYAINVILEKPKPIKSSFLEIFKTEIINVTFIILIGLLLLISVLITSALAIVSRYFIEFGFLGNVLLKGTDFLISFGVISLLFAIIFKTMAHASLRWNEVFFGGMLTSFLFVLGKAIIAWYIGKISLVSSLGASGSIVILLLWVYYTSCILFFGAECTKFYRSFSEEKNSL